MGRKKEIENILSEELRRFNQIGGYVENLHEQFLGFAGAKTELGEQDDLNIELDPAEGDTEETPQETPTDAGEETDDLGLGDDLDLGDDLGVEDTETTDTTDSGESTEEIDVTDIVTMTKETGEKTEELEGTIGKQKDSIDSLISKLWTTASTLLSTYCFVVNVSDVAFSSSTVVHFINPPVIVPVVVKVSLPKFIAPEVSVIDPLRIFIVPISADVALIFPVVIVPVVVIGEAPVSIEPKPLVIEPAFNAPV